MTNCHRSKSARSPESQTSVRTAPRPASSSPGGTRPPWPGPRAARSAKLPACLWPLVLGLATLGLTGCQTFPRGAFDLLQPMDVLRSRSYATNVVQEGDIVSITFQYSTNFNSVQKVTLDGLIILDKVGQVKAAGSTLAHLQEELARLYRPYAKNDDLTVKLAVAATSVYITGAVVRPGKIPMDRPTTVLEAIMEAGGFDPYRAKISAVLVMRVEPTGQRTYRLNLRRMMRAYDAEPFFLKPFDVVYVPTKTFNF